MSDHSTRGNVSGIIYVFSWGTNGVIVKLGLGKFKTIFKSFEQLVNHVGNSVLRQLCKSVSKGVLFESPVEHWQC